MSSAFESSIGLSQYAHLAAALEGLHPTQSPRPSSRAARTAASGVPGNALCPLASLGAAAAQGGRHSAALPEPGAGVQQGLGFTAGLDAAAARGGRHSAVLPEPGAEVQRGLGFAATLDAAASRGGSQFANTPESGAGVQQRAATSLLGLEAASGARPAPYADQGLRRTAHGLGTAGWFAAEPAPLRLQRLQTLAISTLGSRASAAVAAAQGCDASCRPAWGLGITLAHAQSLWEAAAENPMTGSERAAGAAQAPADVAGQPGFLLGPELAPEPNPRVSTRTVATRAGSYTFRAVELGCLAGRVNPARDPITGHAVPWPSASASAEAAARFGPQLERAHVSGGPSFVQAPESGSGVSGAFGPIDSVGDLGAPPTLVLLHGFLGAAEDWTAVAAGLAVDHRVLDPSSDDASWACSGRHGWRCLALDLPGHGGSAVDAARGGVFPLPDR